MTRKRPTDTREADLADEVARFEMLALVALGKGECPKCNADIPCERPDVKAAVAAESQASKARARLADLRAELEMASIADPVQRAESLRTRAAAAGSWVAASQLGKQVDEALAKQKADDLAAAERARRNPAEQRQKILATFRAMPDKLREELLKEIMATTTGRSLAH
jgi:hypothetical protein